MISTNLTSRRSTSGPVRYAGDVHRRGLRRAHRHPELLQVCRHLETPAAQAGLIKWLEIVRPAPAPTIPQRDTTDQGPSPRATRRDVLQRLGVGRRDRLPRRHRLAPSWRLPLRATIKASTCLPSWAGLYTWSRTGYPYKKHLAAPMTGSGLHEHHRRASWRTGKVLANAPTLARENAGRLAPSPRSPRRQVSSVSAAQPPTGQRG